MNSSRMFGAFLLLSLGLLGSVVACSSDGTPQGGANNVGRGGSGASAGSGSAGAPTTPGAGAAGGPVSGAGAGGALPSGAGAGGAPPSGAGAGGVPGSAGASQAGAPGSGGGSALPPIGPAPVDKPDTLEIGVRNNCPFPIWIHGAGQGGTLQPDNKQLAKGDLVWYDAPKQWSAARITAFGDGPGQGELDKVEMTLVANNNVLNYNVTYVDWVSLPVEVIGVGTGADCKKAACYVPEATVLSGCPDGLLSGKRCNAARSFCLDGANKNALYCKKLDSAIATCAATKPGCGGAAGATTAEAYACSGFFGGSPKWCAAVNRAMLDNPDSIDTSLFYKNEPYNTYSKWVHQVCPGIYAFAYDDYPANGGESGFHACTGGKQMEITFCPAG
jgi:hypothetical protein